METGLSVVGLPEVQERWTTTPFSQTCNENVLSTRPVSQDIPLSCKPAHHLSGCLVSKSLRSQAMDG